MTIAAAKYTKKDFQSEETVRWCPGCGDYSVLNAVQGIFPMLGIPREKFVVISGIGCSSRFPYYMNTYGFHSIHGRALPIALGVKVTNPELSVWVATGDGDALSIGGNHFIHSLRKNVGLKILCFNNRIYGLTKGQYSPTTELGKVNKTAPYGTVDQPVNPISLALASEATFIARTCDIYAKHMQEVLQAMARHEGSAFLEIYQNCIVFNQGAYEPITERDVRDDRNLYLEHGKPLVFGKNRERGIRFNGRRVEACGADAKDVLVHDETDATLAYMLSRLEAPDFPAPMGIFRRVSHPTLEGRIHEQIAQTKKKYGQGTLKSLLHQGDLWEVKAGSGN